MAKYGADGIPLTGRAKEYATELWLGGPSAFWLNPDGPLSDLTPDEYLEREAAKVHPLQNVVDQINQAACARGMLGSYANAAHWAQIQAHQNALAQYQQTRAFLGLWGSSLGQIL